MIDVWQTLESAFPRIVGEFREAEANIAKHPIEDITNWRRMMDFALFGKQPINGKIITETLSRRAYMNPVAMEAEFTSLAEQDFAQKQDDGTFIATDNGTSVYLDYEKARMTAFSQVQLLSDEDFNQLIAFLQKGYEQAKSAERPKQKPSMAIGYNFYTSLAEMGGQLGGLLGWINLFELYRDDVHASVWKNVGFTGVQMEVFTQLWHGENYNASKLAEKLAYRGYIEADYQIVLDELDESQLVTQTDDTYTLTDKGRELRQSIETHTERIFNRFCEMTFSEDEANEFANIIDRLKNS
ncbi:MAG: MarR family winged helix-turn-helix transcriptional regulator [Chloroflexota bacterium]